MESDMSWEQNALINELIQGMEIARKLKEDLRSPSSIDTRDSLLQSILSCYDKALLILRWNASISEPHNMMHQATISKTLSPESPLPVDTNPPREDVEVGLKEINPKKRKMMPEWMDLVRVKIENGVEGPSEDGYSWRKYGQKDILGAKYPRSYYRCRFRKTKGCEATKQVQRSDEDPTIFDITYKGSHTCCQGNNVVLPPKSPNMQEKPHCYTNDVHNALSPEERLTKFRNCLTVNTDNLGNKQMAFASGIDNNDDPFWGSLSQTHLLSPYSDIIFASASTNNSPIFDFNLSLDAVGIDSNFPFNDSGFFS